MASKPISSSNQPLDQTCAAPHPDLSLSCHPKPTHNPVNVVYGDAPLGDAMSVPSAPAQDDYSPNPSPKTLSQFTSSPLPHSPVDDICASGSDDLGSTSGYRKKYDNRYDVKQDTHVLESLPMQAPPSSSLSFGVNSAPTNDSPSNSEDRDDVKPHRVGNAVTKDRKGNRVNHGKASPKTATHEGGLVKASWTDNLLSKIGIDRTDTSGAAGAASVEGKKNGNPSQRPDKLSKRSKWLFAVMSLVAVASGGLGASLALMMNSKPFQKPLSAQEAAVFNQDGSMTAAGAGLPSLTRPVNILVLGTIMLTSDVPGAPTQNKERHLEELDGNLNGMSDAMLLIRFDPETRKVSVLSIPRDTRVAIQGVGTTKINFANYAGGASLSAQTVSRNLGDITIDRYVRLNVSGFGKLIDALGGVDIYVPKLMKYQDDSQHLYISLKAGQQRLNGSRAIQYMRYRHDDLGDIGRVQRQQAFFRALIEQKMKPATILKTPEIMNVLKENIDTNLSVEEILALGYFITQVQRQDVKMLMLPGRFANPGEFDALSYWVFDQRLTRKLLDKHFGVPLPQRKDDAADVAGPVMRIAVQDSYAQPEGVKRATVRLSKSGYEQVFPAPEQPWHRPIPKTQIIAQNGDREAAEKVREALGIGEVLVESTGILESDVTVRIGQDWLQANNLPTKAPTPNTTSTNRNKSGAARL